MKTIQSQTSLSNLEVAEKCFGPQHHSHVFRYRGGMKWKDFKDAKYDYIKELKAKLYEEEEENCNLKRRIDIIESILDLIENNFTQPQAAPSTSSDDLHQVSLIGFALFSFLYISFACTNWLNIILA